MFRSVPQLKKRRNNIPIFFIFYLISLLYILTCTLCYNIMYLISLLHLILSWHTISKSLKKASSLSTFNFNVLSSRSFFTTFIQVVFVWPRFFFTSLHASLSATFAGVWLSRRRRCPSHESLLCLIFLLHVSAFAIVYNLSFVITLGHFTFSAFLSILRWKLSIFPLSDFSILFQKIAVFLWYAKHNKLHSSDSNVLGIEKNGCTLRVSTQVKLQQVFMIAASCELKKMATL